MPAGHAGRDDGRGKRAGRGRRPWARLCRPPAFGTRGHSDRGRATGGEGRHRCKPGGKIWSASWARPADGKGKRRNSSHYAAPGWRLSVGKKTREKSHENTTDLLTTQ